MPSDLHRARGYAQEVTIECMRRMQARGMTQFGIEFNTFAEISSLLVWSPPFTRIERR